MGGDGSSSITEMTHREKASNFPPPLNLFPRTPLGDTRHRWLVIPYLRFRHITNTCVWELIEDILPIIILRHIFLKYWPLWTLVMTSRGGERVLSLKFNQDHSKSFISSPLTIYYTSLLLFSPVLRRLFYLLHWRRRTNTQRRAPHRKSSLWYTLIQTIFAV